MDYTQSIGDVTELMCIAEFIKRGYTCSIPYGNSAKYDFVADVNNKFWRIQCKSSHYSHSHGKEDINAFSFSTTSQTTNTKGTKKHCYTKDDIDYFATVFNNQVYLVPVEEASTSKTLRFAPPTSGGSYNKAEDYLIEKVLSQNKDFLQSKKNYINRISQNISKEQKKCSVCGKVIDDKADKCVECARIASRKVERPDRETLKKLIRKSSFTELGKQFGVSDKCISAWCKSYLLPHLKSEINKISELDWNNI